MSDINEEDDDNLSAMNGSGLVQPSGSDVTPTQDGGLTEPKDGDDDDLFTVVNSESESDDEMEDM